jgi:hypothetical protein
MDSLLFCRAGGYSAFMDNSASGSLSIPFSSLPFSGKPHYFPAALLHDNHPGERRQ